MNYKSYLLAFATALLCGCTQPNQSIYLSGQVTNMNTDSLYLLNYSGDTLSTTQPNQDGNFTFQLQARTPEFYQLRYGKQNGAELYLQPGDSLTAHFDAAQFGESLNYQGSGAEQNNYLALKIKPEFNWYWNFYEQVPKEERDKKGSSQLYFKTQYIDILKQRLQQFPSETEFQKRIGQNLDFEMASRVMLDRYAFEGAADLHPELTQELSKAMKIEINDAALLKSSKPYLSLVAQRLFAQEELSSIQLSKAYNTIKSKGLQSHFLSQLILALRKQLQYGEDNYKKAEALKTFLQERNIDLGGPVFHLYDKFHEAESVTPAFTYPDANGQMHSLEQFRGNYVYIDFWASWCGPCIKEFPDLKKVKEQYAGKGITFLGISIDQNSRKEKWQQMIKDRSLPGIQLHAPMDGYIDRDEINDDFLEQLYVNSWHIGIPQFTLIDPQGKIIDAFTYRPSNQKLIKLFDQLLSQQGE